MGSEKMGFGYDGKHLIAFNTIEFVPGEPLHLIIDLSQEQLLERAERDIDDLARSLICPQFDAGVRFADYHVGTPLPPA